MKLYELPGEYRMWEEAVASNGGEVTEELAAAFDYIADELSVKADAIVALAREAKAEAETYRAEARDFQGKAQAAENREASLKGYLLSTLKQMELDRVKGRRFAVSIAKAARPMITWPHGKDIPEPFRRVRVELDKDLALDAYEAGELPADFAVHFTEYLRIR